MFKRVPCKPALFALLLCLPTPAQGAWAERIPAHSPSARLRSGMTYDSHRQKVVLFGGWDGTIPWDDTWEWDGTDWEQITPIQSPPRRAFSRMVYDAARKRMVIFGGYDLVNNKNVILDDTWEYDGNTWTQIQVQGPSPRYFHSMAYDPDRQVTVLFGGHDDNTLFQDTWEYDGTAWTERSPATVPDPPRREAGIAYDQKRDVMVMQGGSGPNGQIRDTWEYDGTDWVQRNPQPQLPSFVKFDMAYDEARERVMLFGDLGNTHAWEYDGTGWTEMVLPLLPRRRDHPTITYDAARERMVLFGGIVAQLALLADTWEYSASCGEGQGNSLLARLEVNLWGKGICQGPFEIPIDIGGTVTFEWEGWPLMPFALMIGPRKPDAVPLACYGIPNIGTPPLYQDVQPTLPFFIIGLDGTAKQTFSVPPLPPGAMINVQGAVQQPPGLPCPVSLTSAFYLVVR